MRSGSRIQSDFYDNQRPFVESLQAKNVLVDRASTSPGGRTSCGRSTIRMSGSLLVGERGWTPEEWEQWFGDTICEQLLGAGRPARDDLHPAPTYLMRSACRTTGPGEPFASVNCRTTV